jgi:hypothetical protein
VAPSLALAILTAGAATEWPAEQVPARSGRVEQAGMLVQRARAAGIEFLTTNNRKSRDEARDELDVSEKIGRD